MPEKVSSKLGWMNVETKKFKRFRCYVLNNLWFENFCEFCLLLIIRWFDFGSGHINVGHFSSRIAHRIIWNWVLVGEKPNEKMHIALLLNRILVQTRQWCFAGSIVALDLNHLHWRQIIKIENIKTYSCMLFVNVLFFLCVCVSECDCSCF